MKKHSRLVERIVRPYLIFIALILAAAMIVMYFSVVTKLNYEAENAGTKIAETMARQVDTYIEEIDVLAQQVKRQPRIINIFYNLNNTKNDKSNFFNDNVLLGIDVSSILNGLITDRNGNFNISVYNGYGDFVSNQNYFIDKKKFQSTMENINYAIELNQIEENDDEISLGAMVTLRQMETSQLLNRYFGDFFVQMVRHIVGVQFRNCATIGGSIWGRYGFSDVLTMFLAMDTWVELYDAGRIPLTEFVNRKKDNDILVNIIVRKQPLFVCYMSQRNSKTDFPVLTCAASLIGEEARTVIGARPARAVVVEDKESILKNFKHMTNKQRGEAIEKFAEYAAEHVTTAGNMRASAEYRTLLVKVLIRRTWEAVGGMKNEY